MISRRKDAVVAIALLISSVWDRRSTAGDRPTAKWIRLVRLQQFFESFMKGGDQNSF
jgi:hypothetical protein